MNTTRKHASTRRALCAAAAICALTAGCVTLPVLPAAPLPPEAVKPVIAVTAFDEHNAGFKHWDVGGGMADLLTSELIKSGNFRVVERRHLDKVFGEIDWQKDARFRPEGRVAQGRLANAQFLIRGVVNDFSEVSGGSLFVGLAKYLLGGKGNRARVALTLTIVNVESGEIVDSAQAAGSAWARKAYAEGVYKQIDFGGKAFFNTPIGGATASAIRRGVRALVKKVPRVMWEPMIADVADGRVLINGGADRGIAVGAEYTVREAGRQVTDPVTGDVLSTLPGRMVGALRVVEVRERIAVAEPVSGGGFSRAQRLEPIRPAPAK
ncbi:MAG: hypothetical protein FJ225_10345 [Lentisphaerae bacterium]|nr:hypothetical protein [Lentisphaerota bacterium]